MTIRLRDATGHDLDPILELNRMAGVSVAAIDRPALAGCFASAAYFRVAEIDGGLAAFLIGTDQAGCHGNTGFGWFQQRHPAFLYIDRIVVAEPFRGHGLGRLLYTDLISFAEVRVPVLGCQVSLEPRDQASLLFHASLGFQEVAQLAAPDGRRLGVMERALCSFGYVQDQYLRDGQAGLPTLPWLADRSRQDDGRPYLAGCA
jgi:predicted GNAT superfamily acetyltransferase